MNLNYKHAKDKHKVIRNFGKERVDSSLLLKHLINNINTLAYNPYSNNRPTRS
jgi:hypothetical protein